MRRKLLAACLSLAAALALTGAAVAGNGGFAPVKPASPNAQRIDDIYWLLVGVAVFVFLLVTVPLVLFVVRFRSGGRDRSVEGPQVRGNTNLELGWTAGAIAILIVIGAFVFYKLPGIRTLESAGAAQELRVRVEGRQFYWQYVYPNGAVAIDRLRAPADQVVKLEITAPESDVIHSFWIPALGGKLDAIPGVVNHTSFRAKEGLYLGQCAELCGIQHAAMGAEVEVLPADEFQRWVDQRAGDLAALGEEEWNGVCAKCHNIGAESRKIGPSLSAGQLEDAAALASLVRTGRNQMPAVGRGWSDEQIRALTDYTKRLAGTISSGG